MTWCRSSLIAAVRPASRCAGNRGAAEPAPGGFVTRARQHGSFVTLGIGEQVGHPVQGPVGPDDLDGVAVPVAVAADRRGTGRSGRCARSCCDEDTPLSEGASAELECLRIGAAAALLSSAEIIGDPE